MQGLIEGPITPTKGAPIELDSYHECSQSTAPTRDIVGCETSHKFLPSRYDMKLALSPGVS